MKNLKLLLSTLGVLSILVLGIGIFTSSSSVEQSNSEVLSELSTELAVVKAELTDLKKHNTASSVSMEPFIGEVIMFAGNFAPRGWAFCEGQLLPISQYSALFSILGTTYGGDGRTTFALPDLRGRSPIGPAPGPGADQIRLGARGGSYLHMSNASELASHNHDAAIPTTPFDLNQMRQGTYKPGNSSFLTVGNLTKEKTNIITSNSGGNQGFNIRDPYLGLHYIIALQGTYPSRS